MCWPAGTIPSFRTNGHLTARLPGGRERPLFASAPSPRYLLVISENASHLRFLQFTGGGWICFLTIPSRVPCSFLVCKCFPFIPSSSQTVPFPGPKTPVSSDLQVHVLLISRFQLGAPCTILHEPHLGVGERARYPAACGDLCIQHTRTRQGCASSHKQSLRRALFIFFFLRVHVVEGN
jgi:hypothetical protein